MYLSNTCKRRKRALWSIEGHLIRKSLMGKGAVGGGGGVGGWGSRGGGLGDGSNNLYTLNACISI